jgi:hypothetical protein
MVRPEKLSIVKERIFSLNLKHIGDIPVDSVLENAIFEGQSIMNMQNPIAFESIRRIMKTIGE